MKPIIRVENLSKRYQLGGDQKPYATFRESLIETARKPLQMFKRGNGNAKEKNSFWALKGINFEVQPGEVVGIIGRNGAGKSTLLKVLSRITEPTEGRIELFGRVGSLLEVGTGFHPELTGRENIFLNGSILGMRREEIARKFDEIVDFAEVEKFLDTTVKHYSSGMYMRLAFAVAANLEPEILVVDEVLAVGDAEFQKKCLGKMKDVSRHGRTVLFVSHNISAIRNLCNKGIYLKSGEVCQSGEIEKTIAAYSNQETDDFDYSDIKRRNIVEVEKINFSVNGVNTDTVANGDELIISIELNYNLQESKKISIGIALENVYGDFVMINYTNFHNVFFESRSSICEAKIKKVPWASGSHKLHLRILGDNEEIYWNTSTRNLTIETGDFFGTGVKGEENLCSWLQDVGWSAKYD